MDRPPDVANTKEFHVSSPSKRLSAPMMGHRDSWESDSSDEEVAPNHSSSLQVTSKGVLTLRQMQDVDSLRKSVQMAVNVPEDKEPTYSSQMSAEPMTQTLSLLNLPNLSMRIPGVPGAAPIDSAFDASRRDSTVSTTSHARKSGDFTPLAGSRRESLARKRRRSQSLPGTRRASFMNMESLAELASIGSVVEKKLSLDSGGSEETYGNKTESIAEFEILAVWKNMASAKTGLGRSQKSQILDRVMAQEMFSEENALNVDTTRCFMIHPSSIIHITWDLAGLFLIFFDCILIPLEVFDPPHSGFLDVMTWLARFFWTVHIYVSFTTGFMLPEGKVEMNPTIVAWNYLCTWLPFDTILVIFDWVEVFVRGSGNTSMIMAARVIRSFRMFRTVKVVRMLQTPEFARTLTVNVRSEELILMAVIVKVVIFMLATTHILACAWYAIGRWQTVESWLEVHEVALLPFGQKYLWSFHWALSQFSGEAFIMPTTSVERTFIIFALFLCFMLSTYIVSRITTSITQIQLISNQQSSQNAALRRYLHDHKISRSLSLRVENNAQFVLADMKRSAPESSVELLKLISEPLLVELHFEVNFSVLSHHPFFALYHEIYPSGVRKLCHNAVSVLSLSRADILFSEGEVVSNPRMFFPDSGDMEYKQECAEHARHLHPRDWLCEHVLWTLWTHAGTLSATSDCRLNVLDAGKFQRIVCHSYTHEVIQYAESFVKSMNDKLKMKEDMSDIGEYDSAIERILHRVFPMEDIEEEEDSEKDSENGSEKSEESLEAKPDNRRTSRSSIGSKKKVKFGANPSEHSRTPPNVGIMKKLLRISAVQVKGPRLSDRKLSDRIASLRHSESSQNPTGFGFKAEKRRSFTDKLLGGIGVRKKVLTFKQETEVVPFPT